MSDLIDEANEHAARELDALLEAQRARAAVHSMPASFDGRCTDCGEEIGEARLRALPMTGRCIECARIAEIYNKEFAWRSR